MTSSFGKSPVPEPSSNADRLTLENALLGILNGPKAGHTLAINKPTMLLGRNDPPSFSVDIDLAPFELNATPVISRRHAELNWVEGHLQLLDLGSTNGTFVNGQKVHAEQSEHSCVTVLKMGDKIRFADLETEVTHG